MEILGYIYHFFATDALKMKNKISINPMNKINSKI